MSSKKQELTKVNDLVSLGQDGIPELLEQVNQKIKTITGNSKPKASTDGKNFPGFGTINSVKKVGDLIKMHSAVVNRAEAYTKSAKTLNLSLTKFPFKIEGCSKNQWVEDISFQAKLLANKAELDKLKKIKQKLEENLSAKDKWIRDMKDIGNLLIDESELE